MGETERDRDMGSKGDPEGGDSERQVQRGGDQERKEYRERGPGRKEESQVGGRSGSLVTPLTW